MHKCKKLTRRVGARIARIARIVIHLFSNFYCLLFGSVSTFLALHARTSALVRKELLVYATAYDSFPGTVVFLVLGQQHRVNTGSNIKTTAIIKQNKKVRKASNSRGCKKQINIGSCWRIMRERLQ